MKYLAKVNLENGVPVECFLRCEDPVDTVAVRGPDAAKYKDGAEYELELGPGMVEEIDAEGKPHQVARHFDGVNRSVKSAKEIPAAKEAKGKAKPDGDAQNTGT